MSAAGLYIHIPFCAAFCDYCDFFSLSAGKYSEQYMDLFLAAVIEDVKRQIYFFNIDQFPTVYIGGGTPSVLGARRIKILLDALNALPGFSPVEFTVEANPESADERFLSACREGGVNRLSLGIQSFHEPSRRIVSRAGRADMLEERLALVSRFFSGAFSADLIAGLPEQTEKIVLDDVKRLLDFAPSHVSLYSLSVSAGTPLERKIKSKEVTLPSHNKADTLWLAGKDALQNAGFQHYEVSNFALPGKRSLHNIRYWMMDNWLGAGPSASGTIVNEDNGIAKRFTYPDDLENYIKSPSLNKAVCEELDSSALIKESLLMGFRYREGPDAQKFKRRFGCNIEECIPETLARWKGRDIMLFLNNFLIEAFVEIDKK